ncbi:hypothetical protein DFJ74DRAFT_709030 [Hyaloraphidium curvatum]|nr:hypothetical protein DFJ74DRAFT_709030 [Hyaloraphidium curvatum]
MAPGAAPTYTPADHERRPKAFRAKPAHGGAACLCCNAFETAAGSPDLLLCSACRVAAYCSAKCQKANWAEHKAFCGAYKKAALPLYALLRDGPGAAGATNKDAKIHADAIGASFPDSFPDGKLAADAPLPQAARLQLMNRTLQLVLRALPFGDGMAAQIAKEHAFQTPHCAVCNKPGPLVAPKDGETVPARLLPCPVCRISFACRAHSEEHRASHSGELSRECASGVRAVKLELFRDAHFAREGDELKLPVYAPETTVKEIAPLPGPPSALLAGGADGPGFDAPGAWDAYFSWRGFPGFVPEFRIWLTDSLSPVLTVFDALVALHGLEELGKKKDITVELVGADSWELERMRAFEELLHLLPRLCTLHLRMVGPDLREAVSMPMHSGPVDLGCCPPCRRAGRKRTVWFHQVDYAAYAAEASKRGWGKPELAAAFHSGISAGEHRDEWKTGLEALRDRGVPCAFTAYNREEITGDVGVLEGLGCGVRWGPGKNRWRGFEWIRDPCGEGEDEGGGRGFYASDAFVVLWQGRQRNA